MRCRQRGAGQGSSRHRSNTVSRKISGRICWMSVRRRELLQRQRHGLCAFLPWCEATVFGMEEIFQGIVRRKPEAVGLAARVMDESRKGRYAHRGMPPETEQALKEIGMQQEFINACRQVEYLFPRPHIVEHLRWELILKWYARHVLSSYLPPSFSNILLEKYENKIVTVYCGKSGDRNRIYGFLFHPGALQFF